MCAVKYSLFEVYAYTLVRRIQTEVLFCRLVLLVRSCLIISCLASSICMTTHMHSQLCKFYVLLFLQQELTAERKEKQELEDMYYQTQMQVNLILCVGAV